MEVSFKKLEERDINNIISLFNKLKAEAAEVTFNHIDSKEELIDWLNNQNYYLYAAMIKDKVVSVFRGVRGLKDEAHCILITIATDPSYRGCKIAQNLIRYSLEDIKAKEKTISLARAYVYSDNKPSINTLLANNFTVSGCVYQHHLNKKIGTYVDDIIFHKIL
ncbi:GNAT family N-acetyltransferase [Natronincola ferrireducens]|uniref:Ribosomal protein S18 acetylase RimI n=1 Tax=Natronincola ferrireducens TaxID=393762 RepID=A0A1G9EN67_9FIRM|nr:GNAT family N-acetyltransferase [Natronincola ferrireducens]SDK77523.1 Ribosomal protein S18 acetylase RimI [Natronincola ferrireducens]